MMNSSRTFLSVILFLFMGLVTQTSIAQSNDKIYDHKTDTLIIINNVLLDTYKTLLTRELVLEADSLLVNQKGLSVKSFKLNALSLGKSIMLDSDGAKFTQAMKNQMDNSKTNYKFIYLKDIVLQSNDGRQVNPSLETIKITFSN